jgi:hypothetical protein
VQNRVSPGVLTGDTVRLKTIFAPAAAPLLVL